MKSSSSGHQDILGLECTEMIIHRSVQTSYKMKKQTLEAKALVTDCLQTQVSVALFFCFAIPWLLLKVESNVQLSIRYSLAGEHYYSDLVPDSSLMMV